MLLARWTIAVAPIAIGKSKKRLNTGSKSVPSPNPEKKVNPAPNRTVIETIKYSISQKKEKIGFNLKFQRVFSHKK